MVKLSPKKKSKSKPKPKAKAKGKPKAVVNLSIDRLADKLREFGIEYRTIGKTLYVFAHPDHKPFQFDAATGECVDIEPQPEEGSTNVAAE